MILNYERTVAYFCPMCSGITTRTIRIFDFSGGKQVCFACGNHNCGEDALQIGMRKDKYQITVQCPVCDETHTYTLKPATFWGKKFFSLQCPTSGIRIFFIGSAEEVSLELDKTTPLVSGIAADMDVEEELGIMFDIVECINDLAKEESIYCTCGSRRITVSAEDKKVILRCAECGKTKEIPATLESLVVLMNTMAIVLEDKH